MSEVQSRILINWRNSLGETQIPAYIVPIKLSGWYEEGAWAASFVPTLLELGTKAYRQESWLMTIELYAPECSSALSEGEKEALLTSWDNLLESFMYQLDLYESVGSNYRFMFSLCLVAYIIGLFSVNTWWFIWFRQPYLALSGIDNWWKRRKTKSFQKCVKKRIIDGQDAMRREAINQVFAFYTQLQKAERDALLDLISFCREREKLNPAFGEIGKIYLSLLQREREESFLLKRIAHTPMKKLARFFLGDLLLLPEIFIPRPIVPVRNLSFDPYAFFQGSDYAQNSSLQAFQ